MTERLMYQLQGFINTPALWNNGDLYDLQQFDLPHLNFIKGLNIISEIPSLSTNFVLGKRMESFFELVIKHSVRYQLIAQNLQVHKEKITLGEIDFIVKDLYHNKPQHVEVVYKFYVYDPDPVKEINRWIGPNRKDSLPQKILKLKKNQLPLLFKPETEKLLSTFHLKSEDMEQLVCYKAMLFVPKDLQHKNFPLINNQSITGYWIHYRDFDRKNYGQHKYYAPKKQDWPVHPKHQEEWMSFAEIKQQVLYYFQHKKSPLIWMKKGEENYERFFMVWWLEY